MRMLPTRRISALIRLALVAGGAIATSCSSAVPQDHETWRCSTPYGRYDQNTLQISPGTHTLSGRIQFHAGEKGEVWNPAAHIAFADSKLPTERDGDCFCNGISAAMYRNLPGIVTFEMISNGESVGIAQAQVGKSITFSVSIDAAGLMTVQIGKTNPARKIVLLIHPGRDMIHMLCSGADVSFLNVQAS